MASLLEIESTPLDRQYAWVTRFKWGLLLLCCLVLPATARADGIDLPIAVGYGLGLFLPLLLFNAAVEAPIMGRFLGIRSRELWWPWFKANLWSLLSGIPVLVVNSMLMEWLVPTELGARVRFYPFFLVGSILLFLFATVLVEFMYARRLVRLTDRRIGTGRLFKAVLLANVASYTVLGPVLFLAEYPRTQVREFTASAAWGKQPALTVIAVDRNGHLTTARVDGQNRRVVVPCEVRDYVVSSNLVECLYRGAQDRFYLYRNGTNLLIPPLGFWCRAPEMDFSPGGRFAAFVGNSEKGLVVRLYDSASGELRDVPILAKGSEFRLAWSAREDSFYLRSGPEYWEMSIGAEVVYTPHSQTPPDLADHFGRVGNAWKRDGVSYMWHEAGELKLFTIPGSASRLKIEKQNETLMEIKDPARTMWVQQAIFVGGDEVLVELGDHFYLADFVVKRVGPVIQGEKFSALMGPFSKRVDF